jgi:hypothetical protein
MAKPKLSKIQEKYEGSVLCRDHAIYFEMPRGTFTFATPTEDLDVDQPIECECCTVAAMRKLGAL